MSKVLIVGSKGMAGHVIYQYLKENTNFEIVDIARGQSSPAPSYQVDVTDFDTLTEIFKSEKPDFVINGIGILNKDAEDNPDKAILMNSYFPHFLAKSGKNLHFRVIHISTDCVFNGKQGGYAEDSEKNGIGFYAQTKALGEINYGNNLTLRTSIIGPELKPDGIGLFHWFMNQDGLIKGYTNAFWTGVTTLELAKSIVEAINQNITGLHHLVNGGKISKFDLTSLFKKVFSKNNITIEAYDGYKVDKSLLKTNDLFNYDVPSYETMLIEMKDWIEGHREIYNHYL
jgi:dTDP-4-dehydrorhamnose reductase